MDKKLYGDDRKMEFDKFDVLEQRLGRLIEDYTALKQENKRLIAGLEEKEKELSGLMERLNKMNSEKGLIKVRVDSILEKIEGILNSEQ